MLDFVEVPHLRLSSTLQNLTLNEETIDLDLRNRRNESSSGSDPFGQCIFNRVLRISKWIYTRVFCLLPPPRGRTSTVNYPHTRPMTRFRHGSRGRRGQVRRKRSVNRFFTENVDFFNSLSEGEILHYYPKDYQYTYSVRVNESFRLTSILTGIRV